MIAVMIHRKGRDGRKHKRQHISFKPLSGIENSPHNVIMVIESSKIVFSILSLLVKIFP